MNFIDCVVHRIRFQYVLKQKFMKHVKFCLLAIALLMMSSGSIKTGEPCIGCYPGERIPNIVLHDIEGNILDLSKYKGKKVESIYQTVWYSDYRKMLDDKKPDGVLVLGPDDKHYEFTMECFQRGIHVLVEKPITRDLRQAQHMCETADKLGLTLMTVSNKRYSPPYFRAKKLLPERPAAFLGKFNLGYDYVDILESGTIHMFDLVRYFMGDVKAVSAIATHHYDFNQCNYSFDNACINLEFKSGSIGNIFTSSTALSLKPWERVEIYGEKNWIAVEDQHTLIVNDSEVGPSKTWSPVFPNTLIFDEEFGGFMGLIENFVQCIRGKEKPLSSGWDGLKAYELVVATHQSIQEKKRIELTLE